MMRRATTPAVVATAVFSLIGLLAPAPAGALTDSEPITISAQMPLRAQLDLVRDGNSVTRFSAGEVVFNRFDDQDGQADGSADFMYSPYRSETGKNWHLAKIVANGSTLTLTADVTGTAGTTPLATIMDVFFGGFFESDGNAKGGASGNWELLDTFTRTLNEPFSGTAPLSYRLRVRGVTAGTHSGTITYSLVSN